MAARRGVLRLTGFAPYALAAGIFVLTPDIVGDQDRATLAVAWPAGEPSDRAVLHASWPGIARPRGTGRHQLAAASPIPAETLDLAALPLEVNRSAKNDRIAAAGHAAIAAASAPDPFQTVPRDNPWPAMMSLATAYAASDPLHSVALAIGPGPASSLSSAQEAEAEIVAAAAEPSIEPPEADGPFGTAALYFGSSYLNAAPMGIQPWAAGEAPVIVARIGSAATVAARPETDTETEERRAAVISIPPARQRVVPAALLGLEGRARARAERCLANAVYFEARSEPVRGQIAVAQVVLNRAFSGYYPEDVCGVVYQGANRHLSCQFTFACDGIPDVVTEPEAWQRAQRIAKATLDGKLWLPDVGKATHYHASYVNPYWVRSMRRLRRIGLHTFYRPRRWGDGADAPSWGSPAHAEIAANL